MGLCDPDFSFADILERFAGLDDHFFRSKRQTLNRIIIDINFMEFGELNKNLFQNFRILQYHAWVWVSQTLLLRTWDFNALEIIFATID